MKPFYTINELADLLDSKVYDVANGLVAAGVLTLHNGKRVDLADYECFRPIYSGENSVVRTGGPPNPNEYTIIVSTAALPAIWVQSIKEAGSHDDEDARELKRSEEKPLETTVGDYKSDDLAFLNQAAFKFWSKIDRDNKGAHPDNDSVAKWLVEKGYSPSAASVAATIIRPAWAAKGRKPRNE